MTLLSADEIRERLASMYADAPFDVTEFTLRMPGLPSAEVDELEEELRCTFPKSLRDGMQSYAFDPLTIGGVTIGSRNGVKDFILEASIEPLVAWWGYGERPRDLILIGSSDGFAIIASIDDGRIFAFHHGEDPGSRTVIATDLDLFVRGLGTANVYRKANGGATAIAADVAQAVGSSSNHFWREFAAGRT